jgi:hypothetical protein
MKKKTLHIVLAGLLIVLIGCGNWMNDILDPLFRDEEFKNEESEDEEFQFNYDIGDTGPGGGIIFYRSAAGFTVQGYTGGTGSFASYNAHYLEAWTGDESGNHQWGTGTLLIPNITDFPAASDSKASLIGNGRRDTRIIVYVAGSGTAANIAASVGHGGKNDWFLPSLGELNHLYKNKAIVGGFSTSNYWSSSQNNFTYAWRQDFNDGSQSDYNKGDLYTKVRAVRAF